jgi:hypothetical protein
LVGLESVRVVAQTLETMGLIQERMRREGHVPGDGDGRSQQIDQLDGRNPRVQ